MLTLGRLRVVDHLLLLLLLRSVTFWEPPPTTLQCLR